MNNEPIVLSIYNAQGALHYLQKELENRRSIMWTMKTGELIDITKMTDTHLKNTISLLEKQIELTELCGDYLNYGDY